MRDFFLTKKKVTYKKNEIILRCGDLPQGVYYLAEGFVRVYTISESGNELTFNIFTPGSFFPIFWAINNSANGYYFEAMNNVTVYLSPQEEFLSYIHDNPDVNSQINELVLHSLNSTLIRLQYLVMGSAQQRVACVLIMLFRRFGKSKKNKLPQINFPITQQQIAHLSALSRESVSIVLKRLMEVGAISRPHRFYVISDYPQLLSKSGYYIDGKPLPYTY